jgi:Homeodomain-like domain
MHSAAIRTRALDLHAAGLSVAAVARVVGVSRTSVADWVRRPDHAMRPRVDLGCFVCTGAAPAEPAAYAYLLGQYLGDGYLATNGRVPRLRIACATDYPKIADEVDAAMHRVSGNRTSAVVGVGYTDRGSYWMHWPCLLPQHGPGAKHTRPIGLTAWQEEIVTTHPWPLIRGLIHSDGCRAINRVTVRGRRYAYPRYFFSNESHDIIGIFCATLDRVGVPWRMCRPNLVSVARRHAVAMLDRHVGPKR